MMDDREDTLTAPNGGSHAPRVRSVERAGQILEALLTTPRGLRLVELSEEVGLHKTTVLRLLRTLVAINMVRKNEADDRYQWDPLRWFLVARNLRDTASRLDLVHDLLRELATVTGQTALLAAPEGRQRNMLLVAIVAPTNSMQVDLRGRASAPMHATPDGKIYLSTLSEALLASHLAQDLAAFTPHTVTRGDALRVQLASIRQQGYAVTRQEFLLNAAAVAVPVWDEKGAMVAALDLIGPLDQHTEANLARWLPQMKAIARQLSQILYPVPGTPGVRPAGDEKDGAVSHNETEFRKTYRIP